LLLGEFDKIGVLQPSQAYAMSLKAAEYDDVLNLSVEDIRVVKYLKGESIDLSEAECDVFKNNAKKSILVCVDGYSLGFGKANGHLLKNKYTPAWRMQS
jgi:NOL1/NOP2/fmu family ribosome biogenesis protein